MAGFFGFFNYAKPGKGVDKNAPPKKRFFLFFELLWRKLFKLIQLNLIYFILTLPLFSILTLYCLSAFGIEAEVIGNDILLTLYAYIATALPKPVTYILVAVSAVLYGPVTAGMTYILRNYAREEHAWLLSDLFERAKQNFKQGLLFGFLDILVFFSLCMYISSSFDSSTLMGQYMTVLKYVAGVVFIIYAVMRFYFYTLMVTFDLKFFAILKNSWLFSILGIVRNLCTILFCCIVILISSFLDIVTVPLITYSLCGFITVFNAYPVIKKYMLDPLEAQKSVNVEYIDDKTDDEAVFSDDVNRYKKDDDNDEE